MKHTLQPRLSILAAGLLALWHVGSPASAAAANRQELWYDSPASQWTEALPVGNGRLGAMVFGGVDRARYQFNEDSLWVGGPHSYAHQGAAEHLSEIRRLLLAGRQRQAERLAMDHFMSVPLRQMAYQPFGDVWLDLDHRAEATGYRRSLDLATAVTTTTYETGGVTYTRKTFASHPDEAIVIHLSCDRPGALDFVARLAGAQPGAQVEPVDDRTLELSGRVRDYDVRADGVVEGQQTYAAQLRLLETDGQVEVQPDVPPDEPAAPAIAVRGASRATLALTAATSFVHFRDVSADPVRRSQQDLQPLADKSFAQLHDRHEADHRQLYDRVSLRLGADSPQPSRDLPTDDRVLAAGQQSDPALAALLFQYGRYLLIASSRAGGQPANLQGLWNDQLEPPWECKYTVNINAEMNYWPSEPCNLAECGQPLFTAIGELAQSGAETARAHYDAPGWVLHHNFDLWRGTAPINAADHGIWPTGGAWLCQHLWWHYLYSGDEAFLRDTAYPTMKAAAEFFADYLFEDPRSEQRWLISGPSNSPEQGGLVLGPTMDHQIIRNLFANTMAAAEVLGVDRPFRQRLARLRARIAPNQVGWLGQLQEWLEDKDDPNNRHRHVSHLWGLFPGDEITPDTPALFDAARKSLELRGDGGTGWSLAWKINLWARLRDGDHAHRMLGNLLTLTDSPKTSHRGGGVYPNLFDAHPPFQIDGNFGATSGICEMLMQSHRSADDDSRLVELLPALPAAWPEGEVSGLRARDGFDIAVAWSEGRLDHCTIHSRRGKPLTLAYGDRRQRLDLAPGETARLDRASLQEASLAR